jgi:alanine dehydrogenase
MTDKRISIGFPIMREEAGERRAFLPRFIQQLARIGFEIILEEGYGFSLDFTLADYRSDFTGIRCGSRAEAFQQDYVLILRSPHAEEFNLIGAESCLISMLHFPTRPLRVQALQEKGIHAISMDSIVNDFNVRLVENMKAVAWNGLETVFGELQTNYPHLVRPDGEPWRVLVLGTGMVGRQALDAATKFGRLDWNEEHLEYDGCGVLPTAAGRNITNNPKRILKLLRESHVIVDSTQRRDASQPIISNNWLAECKPEAVLVDLSVDPYTLSATPPVVKGIEGIPQGNLDQYVFNPDDRKWDESVPKSIPSKYRRKTVSCYSWPGIYPKRCMRVYGQQLLPLMRVLAHKNYETLSPDGPHFERALYRARLDTFLEKQKTGEALPIQLFN